MLGVANGAPAGARRIAFAPEPTPPLRRLPESNIARRWKTGQRSPPRPGSARLPQNARGARKRQEIRKLKLCWWTDREIVRLAYMRAKDYCEAKRGYLLAKRNKATRFADWSDDFRGLVVSFASEIYEEMAWDELAAKHRREKQA